MKFLSAFSAIFCLACAAGVLRADPTVDPASGVTSINELLKLRWNNFQSRPVAVRLERAQFIHEVSATRGLLWQAGQPGQAGQGDQAGQGVLVELARPSALSSGDVLRIEGVASQGEYGPVLTVQQQESLGSAALPPPRVASSSLIAHGAMNAQWLSLTGVVRSCRDVGDGCLDIEIATPEGLVKTRALKPPHRAGDLVDSLVRVRGVCLARTLNRQFMAPYVAVASPDGYEVLASPPAVAFEQELVTADSLLAFRSTGLPLHRVRVRGTVHYADRSGSVFIRDDTGALRLEVVGASFGDFKVGDLVEAIGFPERERHLPFLTESTCRVLETARHSRITPRELQIAESLTDGSISDLVSVEAKLLTMANEPGLVRLLLEAQGKQIEAKLLSNLDATEPPAFEAGSLLMLTGAWRVRLPQYWTTSDGTQIKPEAQTVLLRTVNDVTLVQGPPWLTRRSTQRGLVLVGIGVITALLWIIWNARKRLLLEAASRVAAQHQFAAVMNERSRIARELHDTLAQGLTAISLQLESAKDKLHRAPEGAMTHLETCRSLVRASLTEARASIQHMRSHLLEKMELPQALQHIGEQICHGTSVAFRFHLQGKTRRLAGETENALLRIGQEALTNAAKHAEASEVNLELSYTEDAVKLCVKDNGKGFLVDAVPPSGHFGLQGMRERAQLVQAEYSLHSHSPGGTCITVQKR